MCTAKNTHCHFYKWNRFATSPDLPPNGWKLCDGQVHPILHTIRSSLWSGSFNLYSLMKQKSCQTVKPHLPSPLCPVFSFHHHHPVPPLFQKIPPGDWGRCLERPRDAPHQRRPGEREYTMCTLILNTNLGHFLMWGSITIPSVWMTSIHHSWRIH